MRNGEAGADAPPGAGAFGAAGGFRALGALAVAAAVVLLAAQPAINADVTWYLVASRLIAGGADLYRDLREPNPPFVVWLSQGATQLASASGLPPHRWYFLATAAWLLAALALSRRLLAAVPALPSPQAGCLLIGLAWIFAVVPGLHAGQRDHLAAIGLLPYLVAAATAARTPGRWPRLAVALGLAGAIALKPHYLIVPLAIEAWQLRRTGGRFWPALRQTARRSEALSALPMVLAAALLCLILEPDYLAFLLSHGRLYAALPPLPLEWQAWTLLVLLPLATALALRARLSLAASLLLGGCGALAVTALQGKWWDYHLLAPTLLLLAGLLAALLAMRPGSHRPAGAAALALLLLALPAVGWAALSSWRHLRLYQLDWRKPPFQAELEGWIAAAGGAEARVAVLSGHVVDYMPAVYASGAAWALPDPSLWQLAAYPRLRPPQDAALDALLAEIVAGLAAAPPELLGLQALGESGEPAASFLARADFQALLRRYEPLGENRRTRYWRLRSD